MASSLRQDLNNGDLSARELEEKLNQARNLIAEVRSEVHDVAVQETESDNAADEGQLCGTLSVVLKLLDEELPDTKDHQKG